MSRSAIKAKPKCDISQPQGQIINYPDTSQYIGMTNSNGVPHGLGWFKERHGKVYKGTFENGQFTYGCMNDTYGNEFYGSFKDKLLHGKGYAIYTNPDDWRSPTGRDMYEGNFVNGQPSGQMRVTYGEGQPFMMTK